MNKDSLYDAVFVAVFNAELRTFPTTNSEVYLAIIGLADLVARAAVEKANQ
jgi:hypothetical protein